jgi:tetratricopeptide (TPR) repeat protein
LSRAYRRDGKFVESLTYAEKAIQEYSSAEYYFLRGLAFRELVSWKHALRDITKAIVLEKKNSLGGNEKLTDYYFGRAITLFEMGHDDDAGKDIRKVLHYGEAKKDDYLRDVVRIYEELADHTEEIDKKNKYKLLAIKYQIQIATAGPLEKVAKWFKKIWSK